MAGHHTPAFPRLSDSEKGRCPLPLSHRILRRTSAFFHDATTTSCLTRRATLICREPNHIHPISQQGHICAHTRTCVRTGHDGNLDWTTARLTWIRPMHVRASERIKQRTQRPLRGSSRHPHQQRRVRTQRSSAGRLGGTRKQAGTLPVSLVRVRCVSESPKGGPATAVTGRRKEASRGLRPLRFFSSLAHASRAQTCSGDEMNFERPAGTPAQSVGVSEFVEDAVRSGKHHNAFSKP
ncbi:hypothetical protein EDB86DRAFT_1001555 [Lactarius hatsudake]|nr:hypothetical protein EDB86DRAFT_1001555 [Lactarius hatsudake]